LPAGGGFTRRGGLLKKTSPFMNFMIFMVRAGRRGFFVPLKLRISV
jgi:hypothetical protein